MAAAAPGHLSLELVRDFLMNQRCRVEYKQLVLQFKPFLFDAGNQKHLFSFCHLLTTCLCPYLLIQDLEICSKTLSTQLPMSHKREVPSTLSLNRPFTSARKEVKERRLSRLHHLLLLEMAFKCQILEDPSLLPPLLMATDLGIIMLLELQCRESKFLSNNHRHMFNNSTINNNQ